MSLPDLDTQIELFGLQLQRDKLFKAEDRYRLFAEKVYPVLAKVRDRLEACYYTSGSDPDQGTQFPSLFSHTFEGVCLKLHDCQRPESCGNTEITVNDGNKKRILLVEA